MGISSATDDGILVERHRDGGGTGSFEILYRRYFPRLVRLLAARLRDRDAAEDLAQETLVRTLVHIHRFDVSRPMWPWLKAIALNLACDRASERSREVLTDPPSEAATDDGASYEDRVVLAEALGALSRRQRIAIGLRYLDDWAPDDAAAFLGLSRGAFDQLLFRARARLRAECRRLGAVPMVILMPFRWLRRMARRLSVGFQETATAGAAVGSAAPALVMAVAVLVGGAPPSAAAEWQPPGRPVLAALEGPDGRAPRPSVPEHAGTADASAIPSAPAGPDAEPAVEKDHRPGGDRVGEAKDVAQDVVSDVTDPNGEVDDPGDAQIVDVAFSPGFDRDGTIYAAGQAGCGQGACPPVLFRSADGGATWARLPAEGFRGTQLLLPPDPDDPRVFALTPSGLQVSEDRGDTFRVAATWGPSFSVGSAAISPAFGEGDPRILIGAQSLMRYRADTGLLGPEPYPGMIGPLHPAFSPEQGSDGVILVGGLLWNEAARRLTPTVFRCASSTACDAAPLQNAGGSPIVRVPDDFARTGAAFAFVRGGAASASVDGGRSFQPLPAPWEGGLLWDVAVQDGGVLLAAVAADPGSPDALPSGFYRSEDGGRTWSPVQHPLLASGTRRVAASGEVILVALEGAGLACSTDGGSSWDESCGVSR